MPVRPLVDSYLLDWITTQPLKRELVFEQRNGNVRLMASLTQKLSETGPIWARAIAPWAEFVARTLWGSRSSAKTEQRLPTRLTQRHRREAKGQPPQPEVLAPRPQRICRSCGATLTKRQADYCPPCGAKISRTNMIGKP